MHKNACLKVFKPLTLGLFLTNINNISKTSINKYADIGSPCRASLSNLKYFVVFPPLMMQDPYFNPTNKIYTESKFSKNLQ